MASTAILIPYTARQAVAARTLASRLASERHQVLLAGPGPTEELRGVQHVDCSGGRGAAIRAGLSKISAEITLIHELDTDPDLDIEPLTGPISAGESDAVFARRPPARRRFHALADRALSAFTGLVADAPMKDPLSTLRAFRSSALKSLSLQSDGDGIDAEILVKLAAQQFRLTEVPLGVSPRNGTLSRRLSHARTLLHYATLRNDADNQHEGYNTLARMDSARNYNAWIGRQIRPHLGRRVLEVGAGIGTITREIEGGLELLIALEVDAFYVDRLKNTFRDKAHIRPYLSGVELADWERLGQERIDTVVLTNVLEHIENDGQAVQNFRRVLSPGGKVVLQVPALQSLFGAMDEAVGHFRRYGPEQLRSVLEQNGFAVEQLRWMNLVGIPGWFMNSVMFKRRAVPPIQLRLYDAVAPALATLESRVRLPVGLSLFAVARAV